MFELGLRRQAFSALGARTTQAHRQFPNTQLAYESAISINSITLRCNWQNPIVMIDHPAMLSS